MRHLGSSSEDCGSNPILKFQGLFNYGVIVGSFEFDLTDFRYLCLSGMCFQLVDFPKVQTQTKFRYEIQSPQELLVFYYLKNENFVFHRHCGQA